VSAHRCRNRRSAGGRAPPRIQESRVQRAPEPPEPPHIPARLRRIILFVDDSVLLELWDQTPALIFVADDEMRYFAVNRTAYETLGYSRDELLALHVTDVAVAPDAKPLYNTMIAVGGQLGFTEIATKDGTRLGFHYQAATCTIGGATYYIAAGFVDPALS
jgi:PAS domain S-box-containing protein